MLTAESVRKKLENLQPTQESVETVSLWCLHHKESASVIVSTWLQIFKNSVADKQRLSLLYLVNDVCQKGRKRKGNDYLTVFVPVLKEALLVSKLDSIKQNVERMLNIWQERNVFDATVVKELKSILDTSKSSSSRPSYSAGVVEPQVATFANESEKNVGDFNLSVLIGDIEKHRRNSETVERLRVLLPSTSITCDANTKSLLKSRQEGQRFVDDVNQSYRKLTEFVDECDRRLKRHHQLIIALERAQIFYETQLNEAGIVQTAYEKFGAGVKSVLEQLTKMQNSGNYIYVSSPAADAPSPNPYEDPFAAGIKVDSGSVTKKDTDQLEAVDMDLDEDVKFMTDSSKNTTTHEAALGGMKLATNQSFFTNPPATMTTPVSGTNLDIPMPPKKAKLDPRQQRPQLVPAQPLYPTDHQLTMASASNWTAADASLSDSAYAEEYDYTEATINPLMHPPVTPSFHLPQHSTFGGPSSAMPVDDEPCVYDYEHSSQPSQVVPPPMHNNGDNSNMARSIGRGRGRGRGGFESIPKPKGAPPNLPPHFRPPQNRRYEYTDFRNQLYSVRPAGRGDPRLFRKGSQH